MLAVKESPMVISTPVAKAACKPGEPIIALPAAAVKPVFTTYLLLSPAKVTISPASKVLTFEKPSEKGPVKLVDADDIDNVIEEFLEFIGNRTLVGYYLEFDVAMINKYLKPKFGIKLPNKIHEVSAIYHDYKIEAIPQGNIDLRFDTIMNDLKIPFMGKHDAYNDAIMTSLIFIKLKNLPKVKIK